MGRNNKYIVLWNVMKREFRRLVSRPLYLFCMVIAPLFCYIFFTTLMDSGLPTNMPVGVVDQDMTATSRQLVRNLDAFEQTAVVAHYPNIADARIAMQKGEIYGFYYIPEGTSAKAQAQRQPKVSFYTNNTLLIAGSLLFKDMKMMSELASGAAARAALYAKGATEKHGISATDCHRHSPAEQSLAELLRIPVQYFCPRRADAAYLYGNRLFHRRGNQRPHCPRMAAHGKQLHLDFPCRKAAATHCHILPYGNTVQCLSVRFPALSLQQRNSANAARHPLPGAGIARYGHTYDRHAPHTASGT